MAKPKKSFREKLAECKDLPKLLFIPAPRQVDEMMREVPAGKVTTIEEIRAALARRNGATTTCPLTTGIFAWIAAHAAEEAAAEGVADVTPWWRTLKTGGILNPKVPGGIAAQKRRLEAEGHRVRRLKKDTVVADYGQALFTFGG
jgi:alkylated DNA nucleotide flippase Atl1